jgi:hypothetical protein
MAQRPEQRKDLASLESQSSAGVQLRLERGKSVVPIGEEVAFLFTTNQDGFVTLWDIGTSRRVKRIYPRTAAAAPVRAGHQYGAGGADTPLQFEVQGPEGMEEVYLVWTRTPDAQPKQLDYPNVQALSKDLQPTERLASPDWATAKVAFEVIASGQLSGCPGPLQTHVSYAGAVYILALGANVNGLTKANADVRRLSGCLQALFHVPASHVRLVENAYTRDFREGMHWLQTVVKPADLVFFLFSGHGTFITDDNGDEPSGWDAAFVMRDAEGVPVPSIAHFIRDDEFAALVEQVPTKNVVSFIDACFSSELARKGDDETATLLKGRIKLFDSKALGIPALEWLIGGRRAQQKAGFDAPTKGLIYAAADGHEYAYEVEEGGLFTTTLIDELRRATYGNFMTVFDTTALLVRRKSQKQQNPRALGDRALGTALQLSRP